MENAIPVTDGRGERPLDVAEHLALHQSFRDRGTVEDNQGTLRAAAGIVNGPGDQFLSGAALPIDADIGIGFGYLGDLGENVLHAFRCADQVGELPRNLLNRRERGFVENQAASEERPLQDGDQGQTFRRLGDEIEGAGREAFVCALFVSIPGDDGDWRLYPIDPGEAQELLPPAPRHHQVAEHHVESVGRQQFAGSDSVFRHLDVQRQFAEKAAQELCLRHVIVYDKYPTSRQRCIHSFALTVGIRVNCIPLRLTLVNLVFRGEVLLAFLASLLYNV